MNVLITSAGRRTSLVSAFKKATQRRGGRIIAGDIDGLAPSLFLADDAVRLPRVTDPGFASFLLQLVQERQIRLVVPTIDTELPVFAELRPQFQRIGCELLISSPELVAISGDKWSTATAFRSPEIQVPASWLPAEVDIAELPEQLFLKPRDGSASKDTHRVTREDLQSVLPRVKNAIIQEEIVAPEITVDAFLDFSGKPLHFVPRLRIRALGGESIQGVTLSSSSLEAWVLHVLCRVGELGGRGAITLQAFLTEPTPTLLEINPRFGGGFPLAHAAGGDYPEWLLQLLEGQQLEPRLGKFQANLYMTRHYVEVFSDSPQW